MKGKSHAEAVGEKKIFSTSHQQATFRHLLGSGASVHVVAWADRRFHNENPPPPLLLVSLQLLSLNRLSYNKEYPFSWFRSAALAMPPPQLLPPPAFGRGWRQP